MKPFLRLRTTEDALAELARVQPLATERIPVRGALGRVLAEAVTAREDVPHFFRSNMDGFAVRAADTFAASEQSSTMLRLAGEVAMGEEALLALPAASAIRVSTGAMMPPGADAVVLVEHTEELPGQVLLRRAVTTGQNTIVIGEDLREGEVVLAAGHRLRGCDIGVATGVGRAEVSVHRRVRVGVAATGDEIVEPEDALPPGRVRNVNQYLLGSMARATGAEVVDYGVVRDDEAALAELFAAAARQCDVLLLSGGSSRGSKDFVLSSLLAVPGSQLRFHGVAIAPGKPTMFAEVGPLSVLGVPGNPAAAAVVFTLFASVLIRLREGEGLARILATRPRVRARLAEAVSSTPGREDYLRVRLAEAHPQELPEGSHPPDAGHGAAVGQGHPAAAVASLAPLPLAIPVRGKSVAISTIARADGLLRIPRSSEGLEAGAETEVLLF